MTPEHGFLQLQDDLLKMWPALKRLPAAVSKYSGENAEMERIRPRESCKEKELQLVSSTNEIKFCAAVDNSRLHTFSREAFGFEEDMLITIDVPIYLDGNLLRKHEERQQKKQNLHYLWIALQIALVMALIGFLIMLRS